MATASTNSLDSFADAVSSIGTQRFDGALLAAVNTVALVDHLTVLTYRPNEGLKTLGIASRTDLGSARSLTRNYVAHQQVLDPNFPEITRPSRSRQIVVRRHDPMRLPTNAYQQRFYTTVGILE